MNKRRILFGIITIFWMVFIFGMSGQQGDDSGALSSKVCETICQIFVKNYSSLPGEEQMDLIQKIQYPVRKGAHVTEYAILGMLLCGVFFHEKNSVRNSLFVIIIGFLYALLDEFHQTFIPGRAGQIKDVLIDTGGVLLGVLLVWFGLCLLKKRKTRNGDR